jgi:large conductance mechanosensitive channel
MFKEFKEFAVRGNVVDMAVGIIIGAAFGAIVKSLVDDVIMPPVGFILGNVDFSNIYLMLKEGAIAGPYASLVEAQKAGAVTINVGTFVNAIISFIIIAFTVFILVRTLNRLKKKQEAEAAPDAKECKYCFTKINNKAIRCPQCTSDLSG